jgi:hypothetical protein
MRARLAIVVAIATLGLVVATDALADNPPTQVLPADGASFTSPADQLIFQTLTPAGANPSPNRVDFYVSKDNLHDSNRVLANWFDHLRGNPTTDNPMLYAASPSSDVNWPDRPDTYYWQAVYRDCVQAGPYSLDCLNISGTQSFKINPRPASTVGRGSEPKTFLDFHPRHRTHKRKVKFAFSSDVIGANFQCFYAKGWAACKSPHIFRHLEPGRFRFQTRAVVNGVEDPSPASWFFRVLR